MASITDFTIPEQSKISDYAASKKRPLTDEELNNLYTESRVVRGGGNVGNQTSPFYTPGYVAPTYGGGSPQGGAFAPGAAPAGVPDYNAQFSAYQAANPGIDYTAEQARIQKTQDEARGAAMNRISSSAVTERNLATAYGAKREAGVTAGLGMSQGLNWTSTGQDAIYNVTQDTLGQISKINAAEADALANAESSGLEATSAALSKLREDRQTHDNSLIQAFNDIARNTISSQSEARLQAGQKETDQNTKRDDARAVIQNMLSNFSGAELKDLPQAMKDQIATLETTAGYPTGFISQGLTSLKQAKQQSDLAVKQGQLDAKTAKDQMDAYIKTALGTQKGVTVNIPGLGPVSGDKTYAPTQRQQAPGELSSQEQITDDKGSTVGFKNTMKDGSIKYLDLDGKPMSKLPKGAKFVKTATPGKSSAGMEITLPSGAKVTL